jgi:exosortase
LTEAPGRTRAGLRIRAPAVAWIGLGALALVGWREGLAFAVSSGGAPDVEHVFFEAADNPPWLISIIAAALLFSRRADLRAALGAPGSLVAASALLAPGLALLGWGRFVSAPDLALLGTLAMALGAAWLAGGPRLAKLLAIPLGLLLFALPVPGALVNQVVYPLQIVTADYAYAILDAIGALAMQTADVIRTPNKTFLVIEGCSGLGSMEVLSLLALAWAWQTRASLREGLALVLAAPAIAFFLNGFRVVGLVLFPDSELWSVHTTQGIVVFALGALAIAGLDRLLRRAPEEPVTPAPLRAWPRPSAALGLWLAAATLVSLLVPRFTPEGLGAPRELLPAALPGWTGEEIPIDHLYLGSVRFDRDAAREYRAEKPPPASTSGAPVRVSAFIGESDRRSRATSVISPKNRLPGRGWRIESVEPEILPGRIHAEKVTARLEGRRILAYVWYVGLEGPWREALRAFLGLDQSPFQRSRRAYAVRLWTDLSPGPIEARYAARRVRATLRALGPQLDGLEKRYGGAL